MRFGLYPENQQPKRYWGARAIFNGRNIDIPYDRKSFEGKKEGSDKFLNWINKDFFKWLEGQADLRLYNNQSKVINYNSKNGKYYGQASCNNSYGYLYIGCWEIID